MAAAVYPAETKTKGGNAIYERSHPNMKKKLLCRILSVVLLLCLLPACGSDAVSVMDKNGKIVEVTADGSDTYSFQLSNNGSGSEDSWDNPFVDVTEGAWYYDAIRYCYIHGLMRGTTKTTFSPYLPTSRGMIAATLWRMEGSPAASRPNTFADVPDSQYYTEAITWAAEKGIVDGYSDELFGPEDAITREQMAAVLYRYASYKDYDDGRQASLSRFTDAQNASAYAQPALSWAVANDIINGMEDHTIDPRGDATRAQVASILMYYRENIAKKANG